MPRIVLLTVAAALLAATPASAATVNVQNQNDSGNGSLRKAIADAQPNDDVLVPPGTYNLTSGELHVEKNLQIIGAGAGVGSGKTNITAGGKSRVFLVTDGTVTLKDMRITGGQADLGAGIQVTSTLNLERVVVTGNVASGGNSLGEGGGIALVGPGLHMLNSSVSGNRAGGGGTMGTGIGGGIHVRYAVGSNRTITLDRSTVSNNIAGGAGATGIGGGINTDTESNNSTLDLTVNDSTIAGNVAGGGGGDGFGGGIEAGSGATGADFEITLNRSTVSGNRSGGQSTSGFGGGIDFQSGGNNTAQTLTVTNSTLANNLSGAALGAGVGGAIAFANDGMNGTRNLTLTHTTIARNGAGANNGGGISPSAAASATLRNSIIADNAGGNCAAPFDSTSSNIEDADTCGLSALNGDKPNTPPKLNPLGDYGGFTRTMLPRADSPALNNAQGLYCTPTDQRGVMRPQGAECDIGSDEAQIANVGVTASLTPKTTVAGKVVTYKFAVKNNGPQIAEGVTLVDKLPAKLRRVSVTGCTGTLATGCRIGAIAFGASKTVTIKARALRSGKVVNKGTVSSFAADPTPSNNSAATTLVIRPSLTSLTMNPKSWDDKTTIRFTLSDPGVVTLAFARKGKDGKYHKAGSRKVTGKRGKNTVNFNGDVDGGKSLQPGSYRLTARVKDAGGRTSPAKRLKFKILSP